MTSRACFIGKLTEVLWCGLRWPVITPKIGNWPVFVLLGWRFVFGIFMKWDRREHHIPKCHHDSGSNKAASLLRLLRLNKVTPRTSLIGRPAREYSVSPPCHLTNGVVGRTILRVKPQWVSNPLWSLWFVCFFFVLPIPPTQCWAMVWVIGPLN